tara:strand:+ start:490 stop:753 length:264 start_codon:yes stop_codon:yes gene_type:complete
MAHTTVIKDDSAIYQDGEGILGCDMSGLPDDFHALQWNGSEGHIEYKTIIKPNLPIFSEEEIKTLLGVSLSTLSERRNTRITAIENE